MAKKYSAAKLDLANFDLDIKSKKFPLITSSNVFVGNVDDIDEAGLFSETIFGSFGSKMRLTQFAYIDLKQKVLHPFVYELFKQLMRGIDSILQGNKFYFIEKGVIRDAKASDDHDMLITGFTVVVDNFTSFVKFLRTKKGDNITPGADKKLRTLEKFKTEEASVNKWIVMPAGYRDVNTKTFETDGVIKYEPVNDFYMDLLYISKSAKNTDQYKFLVQKSLEELHTFLTKDQLAGKGGKIKGKMSKKPVAYAARSVITSYDKIAGQTWNDKGVVNIRVGYTGIPVALLVSMFYPFFVYEIRVDLEKNKKFFKALKYLLADYAKVEIKSIPQAIKLFLDIIGKDYKFGFKTLVKLDSKNYLRILDYLKMIAYRIVGKDSPKKFVQATRYPVNNIYSDQFLAIIPIVGTSFTTIKGFEVADDIQSYSNGIIVNDASLDYWGGDFDGDALNFIGVFSEDGNKEIRSKAWFRHKNSNINGDSSGLFRKEELLWGLYNLTKQ